MIATIAAIAEKKTSSAIAEMELFLSQRSLSLRSALRSLNLFFFFFTVIAAIVATIWKPGLRDRYLYYTYRQPFFGSKV